MLRAWRWRLLLIVLFGLLTGWETGFIHSRVVTVDWESEPVEFLVLALNHQGGVAVVDLAPEPIRELRTREGGPRAEATRASRLPGLPPIRSAVTIQSV